MEHTLKLSVAKATFSAVVEGVVNGGDRYIIERHGKPVVAIVSIEDFERIEGWDMPTAEHPIGALAFLGAWGDTTDEEVDKFIEHIYTSREADKGRPVDLDFGQ